MVIAPEALSIPPGRMIDPDTGLFGASWYIDDDGPAVEHTRLVGAEAAIAWGRERADVVLIRLGAHEPGGYLSAGAIPGRLDENEDAPLPDWLPAPDRPAEGWYSPPEPDADTALRLQQAAEEYIANGPHFFKPHESDPSDPRLREEPPPSRHLVAMLKWEMTEEGEDMGPLIVSDPDTREVLWEASEWMRLSEARKLAAEKGWRFDIC